MANLILVISRYFQVKKTWTIKSKVPYLIDAIYKKKEQNQNAQLQFALRNITIVTKRQFIKLLVS